MGSSGAWTVGPTGAGAGTGPLARLGRLQQAPAPAHVPAQTPEPAQGILDIAPAPSTPAEPPASPAPKADRKPTKVQRHTPGIRVLDLTGIEPGPMTVSYDPTFAESKWAKTRLGATTWGGGMWIDPHPLGPDESVPEGLSHVPVPLATPAQVAERWATLHGKRGHGNFGPTVWIMAMDSDGQVCGLWGHAPESCHAIVNTITGGAVDQVPDGASWKLQRQDVGEHAVA